MGLKEYRAKRNFAVSPEPKGAEQPKARRRGALFFCVQKHLASQLHYDFRLEHDGVLLSWAVPKGPSIDPSVKRLAMHVEDHPVEYGTFEGVIPEGYGTGIVLLWDQGTWEPLVDDVGAALAKGDLKLRLNGVKLKGSWALVRTKGGDGRSWLLIKHRDEWAGPIDIAEFAPLSVKSGGDFVDVLEQEAPSIWRSDRAAAGATPLLKIVERAVALRQEQEAREQGGEEPAPRPAASTRKAVGTKPASGRQPAGNATPKRKARPAKSPSTAGGARARSTPRTRGASDRDARSRGARNRPR
ncbi:MAG TPA: DNA polymerase ligase N-terminal domain-containing protein [Methylomirabilota bacterium]